MLRTRFLVHIPAKHKQIGKMPRTLTDSLTPGVTIRCCSGFWFAATGLYVFAIWAVGLPRSHYQGDVAIHNQIHFCSKFFLDKKHAHSKLQTLPSTVLGSLSVHTYICYVVSAVQYGLLSTRPRMKQLIVTCHAREKNPMRLCGRRTCHCYYE